MNEADVEKLMHTYRDALGTCEKAPTRAPKPSVWPRRSALLLAASATVAVGVVALWPKDAVAGTLHRMGQAIKNARTMEVDFQIAEGGRPARHFVHVLYRDGAWRYEVVKSHAIKLTQITKDGLALTDYEKLDHVTIDQASSDKADPLFPAESSALDFAQHFLDSGSVDTKRTISIHPHEPVDGVPVYLITMERPEDQYHGEIVVDKRTDLPISGEVTLVYRTALGPQTVHYRQDYRFNIPIPDRMFSFDTGKRIIRPDEATATQLSSWKHPLAIHGGTAIRDARVTANGTVWVVMTTTNSDILPSRITTAPGQEYVRGGDIDPAGYTGSRPFEIDGDPVAIVPFYPLDPNGTLPKQVRVEFAHRQAAWINARIPEDLREIPAGHPIKLELRREPDNVPDYLPAFNLDNLGFQLDILAWQTRGKSLEKAGDWLRAANAYERAATAYASFVTYAGYRPLEDAARCYRNAGRPDKADEAIRQAEALKHSRER